MQYKITIEVRGAEAYYPGSGKTVISGPCIITLEPEKRSQQSRSSSDSPSTKKDVKSGMNKQDMLSMILDSLINGQRRQMVKQIDEYGTYDFFPDFADYLEDTMGTRLAITNYYRDAVVSYHRIKGK